MGPIGRFLACSFAFSDGGSAENVPLREMFPWRLYRVAKENLPRWRAPMAMFSAVSRSLSRAISTGGDVVRSSNLTAYRSMIAFLMVTFHGRSADPFPEDDFPTGP